MDPALTRQLMVSSNGAAKLTPGSLVLCPFPKLKLKENCTRNPELIDICFMNRVDCDTMHDPEARGFVAGRG